MPTTGGVYSLPPGTIVTAGETILPSQHNPAMEDIAQGLTDRLMRDGSAGMSGDLPMGGNQITGLGAGSAPSHAPRMDQVPTSAFAVSIGALGSVPINQMLYSSAANVAALTNLTGYARGLLAAVNSGEARDVLSVPARSLTLTGGSGINTIGDLSANRTISVDGTVVRTTREVNAGLGMGGGGPLSADRTIFLGTPSSVTATSTNSVTATSHTHELPEAAVRTLIAQGTAGQIGTYAFLQVTAGGALTFGQSVAGSLLTPSNGEGNPVAGSVSGTWQCMGYINGGGTGSRSTLFLRTA